MQVTSLLSQQEHTHDAECATCDHDHDHTPVRLQQTLIGLIFVINAFVVDWLFEQGHIVASASGMIGAIILGYPIVLTGIKDLRRGILSINELVSIAVGVARMKAHGQLKMITEITLSSLRVKAQTSAAMTSTSGV